MKVRIKLLLPFALIFVLTACHKAAPEDEASIGIPECDQLIKQLHDCMASKVSAERLPQLEAAFNAQRAAMKIGAATDKAKAAAQCKATLDSGAFTCPN